MGRQRRRVWGEAGDAGAAVPVPVRRAQCARAAERGGMRAAHGLWAALALLLLPAGSRALRDGECEGEWGRAGGGAGPARLAVHGPGEAK